jgi:mitochondrial enoyl-[acyl-carrier protein] reductase / trans-2-enoyl-CoA reductase
VKQILIDRYGDPQDVARCAEVPDLDVPASGEIVFDVLAFPINPADLWFCRGSYHLRPPLPATPGAECVGRVTAIGTDVKRVRAGDLVINLQRSNWSQRRRVREADVVVVPPDIDLQQAAMLRVNPPTALLLLTDIVTLAPGEWVIQNVANSAVGKLLIGTARRMGLRTVNVVRRTELFEPLRALGADLCLLDGPDLAERVRDATGGAGIRLGIDAVGGPATDRIGQCLSDGATLCNYGSMTGDDPVISRGALIYRGITLTGFMLGRALARRTPQQVRELYSRLADDIRAGAISIPIEQIYPIDRIREALQHAARSERGGKILVAPNGVDLLRPADSQHLRRSVTGVEPLSQIPQRFPPTIASPDDHTLQPTQDLRQASSR